MNLSKNTYGDQQYPNESSATSADPVAELNEFFEADQVDAVVAPEALNSTQQHSVLAPNKDKIVDKAQLQFEAESLEQSVAPKTRRELREALKASQAKARPAKKAVQPAEPEALDKAVDTADVAEAIVATTEQVTSTELVKQVDQVEDLAQPVKTTKELLRRRNRFPLASAVAPEFSVEDDAAKPLSPRAAKRQIEKAVRAARNPKRSEAPVAVVAGKKSAKKHVGRTLLSLTAVLSIAGIGFASAIPNMGASDANANQAQLLAEVANIQPLAAQTMQMTEYEAEALPEASARDGYTAAAPPVKQVFQRWSYHFGAYVNDTSWAIQWPLQSARISSPYGPRWGGMHTGTDFDVATGVPIGSVAAGKVLAAGWNIVNGCGYGVLIDHGVIAGKQTSSLYCHMQGNSSPLAQGQEVTPGTFIGRVGATGWVTGSHLHLEIWLNGSPFGGGGSWADPYVWLSANVG